MKSKIGTITDYSFIIRSEGIWLFFYVRRINTPKAGYNKMLLIRETVRVEYDNAF